MAPSRRAGLSKMDTHRPLAPLAQLIGCAIALVAPVVLKRAVIVTIAVPEPLVAALGCASGTYLISSSPIPFWKLAAPPVPFRSGNDCPVLALVCTAGVEVN